MNEEIERVFTEFAIGLAEDLKRSAQEALRSGGRRSPNPIKLDFNQLVRLTQNGNVVLDIRAVNGGKGVGYWKNIESGRRPGAKRLPADVVGKKWQNENNIDARKVIMSMRTAKKPGREIKYDQAARSLAFIIQGAIYRKGIRPKPFVDRVITEQRISKLRNDLMPLIGNRFMLTIKGLH
jgi:hypothetical protein